MKKIFVIVSVKNESDIIESFCRYNLTFCDGMLIYENHKSSDDTREIISKLIDEGLPLYFEDEEDMYYEDAKGILLQRAINKYGADLVIPLDADEFIYHTKGTDPRQTLESLHEDVEYHAIWRTYLYEREPDIKLGFMPNNFTHYRNPIMEDPNVYERHKKVIVSRFLVEKMEASLVVGTHFLLYPDPRKDDVKTELCNELVFAHFPIRSKAQVMKKSIPNWINKWAQKERTTREALDAFQLGVLFNEIKEHGDISQEKMVQYSLEYAMLLDVSNADDLSKSGRDKLNALIKGLGDRIKINDPLDTTYCQDKLKLYYTDYSNDTKTLIKAVLSQVDTTITYLAMESDERRKYHIEFVDNIYNSKTWKIGSKIQRIFGFLVRNKRN
ncbi:MAG: glycosyltransferase family 2 protein [Oscillospiraceae bacterium]|jgi:hypothetical protein|nr:glycosyltransferase family 2 protein [Oscillospiraceae bacterium]